MSGVPGTGLVAYGTVYPNAQTMFAWFAGHIRSIGVYESLAHVEKIHGHDGAGTRTPPRRLRPPT